MLETSFQDAKVEVKYFKLQEFYADGEEANAFEWQIEITWFNDSILIALPDANTIEDVVAVVNENTVFEFLFETSLRHYQLSSALSGLFLKKKWIPFTPALGAMEGLMFENRGI